MNCLQQFRSWLFLLLLFGSSYSALAVEKIIRTPIVADYGVRDPQFLRSMSQHLHAEITQSNKVTTLINGVQIFPAMLEAIRKAKNTITFENFI